MPVVSITRDDIDINALIKAAKQPETGGIVTFVGIVRDDGIRELDFEAYEDAAIDDMDKIAREAISKFGLNHVEVVHRVGRLPISDTIVAIVAGASHRKEAFDGCEYILDKIKEYVPIWKKDITDTGERWHH